MSAEFASTLPLSSLSPELLIDASAGRLEYVRVALRVDDPGAVLADRTFSVCHGATVDVLAQADSAMGLGRVSYTPGLKGLRKVAGNLVTYRFTVPSAAQPGAVFSVSARGAPGSRPFTFFLRVG